MNKFAVKSLLLLPALIQGKSADEDLNLIPLANDVQPSNSSLGIDKSVKLNLTRTMTYKEHVKNELFKKHLSVGWGKYISYY